MIRSIEQRVDDVRRVLAAARAVHGDRARLLPTIARATGLSPEGVELGFESLERDATTDDLRALVASAGDAAHIHVVLSANVFVAPLRAIAIARAAAQRVTVRPSSRDPALARALVSAVNDPAIAIVDERDVAEMDADRIDVYGRDETIARVRLRAKPGVVVRGHGAGLGLAVVTRSDSLAEAALALAADVVPFDQRGCLSPRIVFVEGSRLRPRQRDRGEAFAAALDSHLAAWEARVPRGAMTEDETAEAIRWKDSLAFAGRVWARSAHAVAFAEAVSAVPPPGRHVLVTWVESMRDAGPRIAALGRFVVTIGTSDPTRLVSARDGWRTIVPKHARIALLGAMQRPPLDGPVDRRDSF